MRTTLILSLLILTSTMGFADQKAWTIDTQEEWEEGIGSPEQFEVKDGMVSLVGKRGTFRSSVKSFGGLRSAESIRFEQSPVWLNWEPTATLIA